jgi:hypothetical protein
MHYAEATDFRVPSLEVAARRLFNGNHSSVIAGVFPLTDDIGLLSLRCGERQNDANRGNRGADS